MPEKKFEIEFLKSLSFTNFCVFRVMHGIRVAGYFSCDFKEAEFRYSIVDNNCIDDDELYTLAYNYIKNDLKGEPPEE